MKSIIIVGFSALIINVFAKKQLCRQTTIPASNKIYITVTQPGGKRKTVTLDNYFNNEWKKDATGKDVPYHYTWDDKENSGFSIFGNIFTMYGVKKNTLTTSPTKENLKNTNIYIIVDPDTEKETEHPNYIQQKDIDVITSWVKQGGVLVLMGNDAGNAEFEHFNLLAGKFGIQFLEETKNKVEGNNFEQGAIKISLHNPILPTTKKIFIKELSPLVVHTPAVVYLKNGFDDIIAVSKFGKGAVFAIGDPWLYNEYVDGKKLPAEYENFNAAEDLVKWLIKQTK